MTFRLPGAAEPGTLFSGDLLFAGSIGRVDLPGGDYATILDSLARVCLPLPDETVVLSGHGPQTTIGAERASNPYLAGLAPPAARPAACKHGPDTAPADPTPARRRQKEGLGAMIRTHEAGTLRAAAAGQQVTLAGWVARRRDHGGVVFIDLRDASGIVQVVLRQEDVAHDLRAEFCVLVTGTVQRPPGREREPRAADRRDRGRRGRRRGAGRVRPAAVPDRERRAS